MYLQLKKKKKIDLTSLTRLPVCLEFIVSLIDRQNIWRFEKPDVGSTVLTFLPVCVLRSPSVEVTLHPNERIG